MTMKLLRAVVTFTRDYEVDSDDYESFDITDILEDEVNAIDVDPMLWMDDCCAGWEVDVMDISDDKESAMWDDSTGALVSEIDIDFASGEISGNCSGCTAGDVAKALLLIARELQGMDETPDYVNFDEDKVSVG